MLCLLITLLIGIHEIDSSRNDNQDLQPLVEYIRHRRHQIYDVEPNDYFEEKENYPKVIVTQHKANKHKKQKNKHEKVKAEPKKIQKRIQKPKPDSETSKKTHKKKNDWIKESYKESNVSESEEKHSPVDIVVHIKMNE
ncbi:uncharacterized protein LOC121737790 [Aricia agestis]|uniref:uncharacterized protein LOC121737790 n=1 Tax=Aricia agestis TaxID=91739 RepID=UPI001C20A0B3|nr:uncharacterized protein LOC121737790 [Aricia agestis]